MKIEIVPIIVNIICTGWYGYQGTEHWKTLYWFAATLITIALYGMNG